MMNETTVGWMCTKCGKAQELEYERSYCCARPRPGAVSARVQETAQPKTPPRTTAQEAQKPISPVERPKSPTTVVVPKGKTWEEVGQKRARETLPEGCGFEIVSYDKRRHLSHRVRSAERRERRRSERSGRKRDRVELGERDMEVLKKIERYMSGKRLSKQFECASSYDASSDASTSSAEHRRSERSPRESPQARARVPVIVQPRAQQSTQAQTSAQLPQQSAQAREQLRSQSEPTQVQEESQSQPITRMEKDMSNPVMVDTMSKVHDAINNTSKKEVRVWRAVCDVFNVSMMEEATDDEMIVSLKTMTYFGTWLLCHR